MFDKLKTFFDDKTDISEINFTPEQVATVALLISTAKYDGAFDEVERDEIMTLIKNYFSLSSDDSNKLFKAAEIIEDESNDLQQFTRTLNLILNEKLNTLIHNNPRIKFQGVVSSRKKLIEIYDEHNIFILPSFTEGQPCVVDESLARKRPVLIFEDIRHIIKDRKGIFVSQRNLDSFTEITEYIMQNYEQIQSEIKKNKLTLEKDMFKEIAAIINK